MGSIMKLKGFRLQFHSYNDSCLLSLNVHERYIFLEWAFDSFWGSLIFKEMVQNLQERGFAGNGRSWSLIELEHRSHILLALKHQAFNVDSNFNNFFDTVGV